MIYNMICMNNLPAADETATLKQKLLWLLAGMLTPQYVYFTSTLHDTFYISIQTLTHLT